MTTADGTPLPADRPAGDGDHGGRHDAGDDSRRTTIVIGAAVVVLAVLAAGTGALHGFDDGVARGGDLVTRLLVGALISAAAGGLLVVGLRRLGTARTAALGLTGAAAMLLVVLVVGAIGATVAVSTAPLHPEVPSVETVVQRATTTLPPPRDTLPADDGGTTSVPSWIGTVLAIVGLIFVFLLVLGITRTFQMPKLRLRGGMRWGNRRDAELTVEDLDVAAAADSFEDSAASIGDGVDPRAAIIAAYARLLDGLATAGCARQPFEAPEEHLHRSLHALGVAPAHMTVIVDRFLVARFSTHPLTAADADTVRAALRDAARQLRDVLAANDATVGGA
ncbi:MAG: DUF4129 domain-containing protein [Ilumatobacteraceae bacterium]